MKKPQRKPRRARNLDDEAISIIVGILDGWTGPLSWDGLIGEIEMRLHSRYTRQALHKHERIRHAFALRRDMLADAPKPKRIGKGTAERHKEQERIARLTAENQRLHAENSRLLEQFARWAYNAHARGLDETFLNQPMPEPQRDRTEPKR